MTTKELIAALKRVDPKGTHDVFIEEADGDVSLHVDVASVNLTVVAEDLDEAQVVIRTESP